MTPTLFPNPEPNRSPPSMKSSTPPTPPSLPPLSPRPLDLLLLHRRPSPPLARYGRSKSIESRSGNIEMGHRKLQLALLLELALLCAAGPRTSPRGSCPRQPSGVVSPKTPGDNGYHILVSGEPQKYVPGAVYTVSIVGSRTHARLQRFTRFALGVEPVDSSGIASPQRVGHFQLFGDSITTFNENCINSVMEASPDFPKTEVQELGPSPDWIVGVSRLDLCRRDCTWIPSKTIDLYLYDAGTDDGITYMVKKIPENHNKGCRPLVSQSERKHDFHLQSRPSSSPLIISLHAGAMVYEDDSHWYMDDSSLSRELCELDEEEDEDDGTGEELGPVKECCACDEAKYQLIFEGLWSNITHPRDFPFSLWLTHFSDVIGASHEGNFTLWEEGGLASAGLRQVAEWGSVRTMEGELRAKVGEEIHHFLLSNISLKSLNLCQK
ncbi:hypothetical protein J437_LFUL004425 [Ladona fulva]|uniref:Spondin domain-containing protein n=1 Tax=Ladona fulva TaxID=123851 RepID=A0A8K0NVK6_LADFU|nr:hypothetical protein J437_LFUL004425 [Ladona fulva]